MGVSTGIPRQLYTDNYGNATRLRTDDSETEFYDAREVRSYFEWYSVNGTNIPAGQRMLFRFNIAINTILTNAVYTIDDGFIRVTSFAGGTPVGAFIATLPTSKSNGMTTAPAYTIANSINRTAAGLAAAVDITGGTAVNVTRIKAANSSSAATTVGSSPDNKLGLAPFTYYILVENIGTGSVEGTLHARWWEEV